MSDHKEIADAAQVVDELRRGCPVHTNVAVLATVWAALYIVRSLRSNAADAAYDARREDEM
jgi:hypothetical protein